MISYHDRYYLSYILVYYIFYANYDNLDQVITGLETSQSEEYLNQVSQCEIEPGIPIEETLPQNFTPLSLN